MNTTLWSSASRSPKCLSSLRRKLEDGRDGPAYIETVRGEGFRLRV